MTTNSLIDTLLPCPFCGGEAKVSKTDIGPGYQTSQVKCKSCPADVGKIGLDAETFWQARHSPALTDEQRAKVVLHLRNALHGLNLHRPDLAALKLGQDLVCGINQQRHIAEEIKAALAAIEQNYNLIPKEK